jgi:hypothetical protein
MSTNPIDWEAVIADLEAKKAQLDSVIQAIRGIANLGVLVGTVPTTQNGSIPSDAFLGMSIPEATKKLLGIVRKRLGTPEIIRMLSQGGLPEPAYNTAYAVLRRRQQQVGDIVNINGDWGLKEWTPGYNPPKKKADKGDEQKDAGTEKAEAVCEPPVMEEEGAELA